MSEEVSLLSLDPERNPLLTLSVREGVSTTALAVLLGLYVLGLGIASFYDLYRGRQTPNWFTHGTILVGLALAPVAFEGWVDHYVTAGFVAFIFFAAYWFGGVGMGDVKLYVGLGLIFGLAAICILAIAHIAAALIMGPIAILRRTRRLAAPMFPFAMIGVLLVIPSIAEPFWISCAGGVLLVGVVAYGLWESRFRPLPDLQRIIGAAGDANRVRVRAGERVLIPEGAGWRPVDGSPRISNGAIDRIVHRIVDMASWKDLDRAGEMYVVAHDQAPEHEVLITESLQGYTLTITRI